MLLSFAGFDVHFCPDYIKRNGRKPALLESIRDEDTGGIEVLILRRWLLVISRSS
jgi:hypothetical protein